ncbi:LysR family transcriptional regulator [Bacillus sp. FJAT-52991]|uniref:LysR family transcriptional regulator n=1 Tax=Bacillus kandeliae TaxID=3129297 RepID=A0ABZ2N7P6_9BACI
MNTEWLQSFVDAANQKSLSKAANLNNISQPALSKHIRHLENDLDVILFHRTSKGIELTEAGERFYARIKPVMAELNAIRQELRTFFQDHPIAIGSLPSLATYYLPSRIKGFNFLGRPINLMIQNTSEELVRSLQEGRLDAAFIDSMYTKSSLWSCELFTEPYCAVVPLGHPFQSKKAVELADLCKEPLIVHQAPCDTRKRIIHQMESLGCKPNIVSEVAFGDFVFGAVSAGMGITISPEMMVKHVSHQQIFTLPITNFGEKRSISLVTQTREIGLKLSRFLSKFEN